MIAIGSVATSPKEFWSTGEGGLYCMEGVMDNLFPLGTVVLVGGSYGVPKLSTPPGHTVQLFDC